MTQQAGHRQRGGQEPIRIPQREPDRQRIAQLRPKSPPCLLSGAAIQLGEVRRQRGRQQVGLVQLHQQPHRLAMTGPLGAHVAGEAIDDVPDRPLPVHQGEQCMGGGGDAEMVAGLVILQHVSHAASAALPVYLGVQPQPRPEIGDAIPALLECMGHQGSRDDVAGAT